MLAGVEALAAAVRRDLAAERPRPEPDHGVVARVGERVISLAQLDARLDAIYRGPMGVRLPAPESPEGTRIRRWAAQLLVSEALILVEAARAGIPVRPHPSQVPATAVTSPNGADEATETAVMEAARELFELVTTGIAVEEKAVLRFYDANADLWEHPEPVSFEEARAEIESELLAAARGSEFDDWLLRRRAEIVTLSPGYEHPGDPTTPDFIHRH